MPVLYDLEDGIVTITLDRPEVLNALDGAMYRDLDEAIDRFARDDDAKVAIVTGSGKAFCSGGDVVYGQELIDRIGLEAAIAVFELKMFSSQVTDKPIIAAVNGKAVGDGVNICLACDLRIAAESASFSMAGVLVGLPSIYGAIRAPRIMGLGYALEFILSGQSRDASWGLKTGLLNEVVPDAQLQDRARELAQELCKGSSAAVRSTKRIALAQYDLTFDQGVHFGSQIRTSMLQGSGVSLELSNGVNGKSKVPTGEIHGRAAEATTLGE